MRKPYKNCMYYYIKLFENDLENHRVMEEQPNHFRRDLACRSGVLDSWIAVQLLKVGCKEEMVLRALAYQLNQRLQAILKQE